MARKFLDIAFTPAVKAAQERHGSRAAYARREGEPDDGALGEAERDFAAARDGFYVASVSQTGWPYVQFRGGPPGFLQALDARTLGWADFRGNRQYVTVGNLAGSAKVCLFLLDYARRRRLKIFGEARLVDAASDPALMERLARPGPDAVVERAVLVAVSGFDWNCPQHITPRFTAREVEAAVAPLRRRLEELEMLLAAQGGAA